MCSFFYVEEVRRAASEGESGEQGTVRVGFTGSGMYVLMPRLIRTFRSAYTRAELEIEG